MSSCVPVKPVTAVSALPATPPIMIYETSISERSGVPSNDSSATLKLIFPPNVQFVISAPLSALPCAPAIPPTQVKSASGSLTAAFTVAFEVMPVILPSFRPATEPTNDRFESKTEESVIVQSSASVKSFTVPSLAIVRNIAPCLPEHSMFRHLIVVPLPSNTPEKLTSAGVIVGISILFADTRSSRSSCERAAKARDM